VTLRRLDYECGLCGNRPNFRVFALMRRALRALRALEDVPDDEPVMTWQCRCGEVHVVPAGAVERVGERVA
jgi:hypothetical protein